MCNGTKPLYWMPYFSFSTGQYGVDSLTIGQARILPDTEETWENEVRFPRHPWCEVYHDWPPLSDDNQEGEKLRGTVILAEDFEWLSENIHLIVAILFFMARRGGNRGVPGERFRYIEMKAKGQYSELVTYFTKTARLMEDPAKFDLHPSVELRGSLSQVGIALTDKTNQHLLHIFSENEKDRLITACHHYFRTQLSDYFAAPLVQDYATYCACLEAILDLDSRTRDIKNAMADAIAECYGEKEKLRKFIYGLYASRSVYVHGLRIGEEETGRNVGLYDYFHSRPFKYSLLKSICWDLLCLKIEEARLTSCLFVELYESPKLIDKVFTSSENWQKMKRLLTQNKAGDVIKERMEKDRDNLMSELELLRQALPDRFDWQCVEDVDDQEGHVKESIKTVCIVIGHLTGSQGPDYDTIDLLGKAAIDKDDEEAIGRWACEHEDWKRPYTQDELFYAIKVLAWTLASYFHPARR